MQSRDDRQVLEEAVRLFLQLEAAPDNAAFQAERDAFISRGEQERAAYSKALEGWKAAGVRPRKTGLKTVLLVAFCTAVAWYGAEPLRISLLADMSAGLSTSQSNLKSGDVVFLDAGSAIVDDTGPDETLRSVTVLKGAAFFDVIPSERTFRVTLGDISAEAIGTAFETAFIEDTLAVEVEEGIVRVTGPSDTWLLEAGTRLEWSGVGDVVLTEVSTAEVALWRQDQLIAKTMPVDQVIDILDRRISGDVFVVGGGLAGRTVSGSFDLSDPIGSLNILAATQNARVLPGQPVATFLIPRD
ncbi:MAG: FecR domain-containing protein [Pseudomonadota bacterium]